MMMSVNPLVLFEFFLICYRHLEKIIKIVENINFSSMIKFHTDKQC